MRRSGARYARLLEEARGGRCPQGLQSAIANAENNKLDIELDVAEATGGRDEAMRPRARGRVGRLEKFSNLRVVVRELPDEARPGAMRRPSLTTGMKLPFADDGDEVAVADDGDEVAVADDDEVAVRDGDAVEERV